MESIEHVNEALVLEALASIPGERECRDGLPPDCGFRECLHVAFWRGLKIVSRRTRIPMEDMVGWLWCRCVEHPGQIVTAWNNAGMSGLVKRMVYTLTWNGYDGYPEVARFKAEFPAGLCQAKPAKNANDSDKGDVLHEALTAYGKVA